MRLGGAGRANAEALDSWVVGKGKIGQVNDAWQAAGFKVPREFVSQEAYRGAVRIFPGLAIKPLRQFIKHLTGTFQHTGRLRSGPALVRGFIQPPAFQHDRPRLGRQR